MKRCIHAGVSHANQGRVTLVKIRELWLALRAITLEGSRMSFFESQKNLSLLHALLPPKAYHDESPFRLHLFDAVPRALIVTTVLSWYSTVSLLDRRVRFDYPERASGDPLLKRNDLRAVRSNDLLRGFRLSSFESGFPCLEFRIGNHAASRPLGIILCTSAATIVGFVTSEVTW